jgi:methylenetetrahydrofolate reductase (NADPH)
VISDSLFRDHTVFSFEIFPPKRNASIDTVYHTLDGLQGLHPDFISVTYGAAGSGNNSATVEIASVIHNQYGIESVAHLPCRYLSRAQAADTVKQLQENGTQNILALRGDTVSDQNPQGDFVHASDLIAFLKQFKHLHIIAACYPETHPEAPDMDTDIRHLKEKTNAGATHLISQLFLDNSCFYSFLKKVRAAGITVPIEAGIMPVINKKQIQHMVSLCGASLPEKFRTMMDRYGDNPDAMRDAGIAYAVDQIVDLVSHGVDGIHLYTMNNPFVARRICKATETLFKK